MGQISFTTLDLGPDLLRNLDALGYKSMTPIQAESLPAILAGKDVIAQAQTGTGKTAAFGIGLLTKLDAKTFSVQALVLCPTRELADQVSKAIRDLARTTANIKVLTLCGGVPFGPQSASLGHGAHVVVGTPGRVEDHLRKGTLNLEAVTTLVLDEADRMLDMGFRETLDKIVQRVSSRRQTLLFSATFPKEIKAIASRIMIEPLRVTAAAADDHVAIEQHFFGVENESQRSTALRLLLLQHRPESVVVFCTTRRDTQALADELQSERFSALALHGDLDQRERDRTLVRFANKSVSILVATDVAARGLDIDSINAVINFQPAGDPQIHVHRIGRTGRAGSHGLAWTIFTDKERYKMDLLAEYLNLDIERESLPSRTLLEQSPTKPAMTTLRVEGGKKQKVRPGDILGALTGDGGIAGKQVGKIDVFDNYAYVAVSRDAARVALNKLSQGKLKGRSFRVRRI